MSTAQKADIRLCWITTKHAGKTMLRPVRMRYCSIEEGELVMAIGGDLVERWKWRRAKKGNSWLIAGAFHSWVNNGGKLYYGGA